VHVPDLEPPDLPAPRFIYFDNLQKHPSPYDLDADYSLVNMPYSPEGFDHLLELTNLTHQFPELTWKLHHGFPIGDMSPLTSTYTPHNLPGADIYREVCDEYIADELSKKHFSGPYTHEQLFTKIGHFRSSPLQVVVKKGINGAPDKHRVCRHLSYRGSMSASINDEINTSNYPTEWGTVAEFADIVRISIHMCLSLSDALCESCSLVRRHENITHISPLISLFLFYQTLIYSSQVQDAPPGAQFATLDIEAAYRGILCLPAHKPYLIVYHDGKLYIDHNIPFGLASAAGLQGEVADATVAIWRELNVKPSKKWVDDVSIFRFLHQQVSMLVSLMAHYTTMNTISIMPNSSSLLRKFCGIQTKARTSTIMAIMLVSSGISLRNLSRSLNSNTLSILLVSPSFSRSSRTQKFRNTN